MAASGCATKPITVGTFHLQRCSRTVGVTCDGSGSCYKSIGTCDDLCSYECQIQESVHTTCNTDVTGGLYRPDIKDEPEIKGSRVKLCSGLPTPGEVVLQYSDTPGCDLIDDPHPEFREHETGRLASGTELEKFGNRHLLEGRRYTLARGCQTGTYPPDFRLRTYWTKSWKPSSDDCFEHRLQDALGFFDLSSSKWPADVRATLQTPITPNSSLVSFDALPPKTQVICVNGEAIKIEYNAAVDIFVIKERGMCGSQKNADQIDVGTEVTVAGYVPCYTNAADFAFTLLHQDGNGLPYEAQDCECGPFINGVLNKDSFDEYKECHFMDFLPEMVICEPTAIRELFEELSFVFLAMPIYRRKTGCIDFYKHQPPQKGELSTITEKHIVNCNFNPKPTNTTPVNFVQIKWDQIDCTKGTSDSNFRETGINPNRSFLADACTNPLWQPGREKKLKTRMIGKKNRFMAPIAAQRMEWIESQRKREFWIEIHKRDMIYEEAEFIQIEHPDIQGPTGFSSDAVFWINQIDDLPGNCHRVHVEDSGFDARDNWAVDMTCDSECPAPLCNTEINCSDSFGLKIW